MREGADYLTQLADTFQPDLVAGLGRAGSLCAQRVLADKGVSYIRHPSYGGKRDFILGMDNIIGN